MNFGFIQITRQGQDTPILVVPVDDHTHRNDAISTVMKHVAPILAPKDNHEPRALSSRIAIFTTIRELGKPNQPLQAYIYSPDGSKFVGEPNAVYFQNLTQHLTPNQKSGLMSSLQKAFPQESQALFASNAATLD